MPFIGELNHIDIGFTRNQLSKVERKIIKITYQDIKKINLPTLPKNVHKYKRGRTLLIAGSTKYQGAALLLSLIHISEPTRPC